MKKTRNIIVPKHKAKEVKELLCEITGTWPFSTEYGDDIYVQTEMTDEEVARADHRLEMIL
jgi:hypothetical protein